STAGFFGAVGAAFSGAGVGTMSCGSAGLAGATLCGAGFCGTDAGGCAGLGAAFGSFAAEGAEGSSCVSLCWAGAAAAQPRHSSTDMSSFIRIVRELSLYRLAPAENAEKLLQIIRQRT